MMIPMYADILKIQAIEFNDQIRKSAYSFELVNNKLRIFPSPTSSYKLWFKYLVKKDGDYEHKEFKFSSKDFFSLTGTIDEDITSK